jgi:hypothetical protein
MKRVILRRIEMGDAGTFGVLEVDRHQFHTGELPWRENRRGKSCVPAGVYRVSWQPSGRYGMKYELQGVPGRSDILIHAANLVGDEDLGYAAQVDGCIALGSARGSIDGQAAVTGSKVAVARFEELMGKEDFELLVVDEYREAGEPESNVA